MEDQEETQEPEEVTGAKGEATGARPDGPVPEGEPPAAAVADGGEAAPPDEAVPGQAPQSDVLPDEVPALTADEVRGIVEALVFASPQPLTPREIAKVLPGVPKEEWLAALEELKADYGRTDRGLQMVEVAAGFQITTRPEMNEYVRELLDPRAPTRLSIQALETLAVIAYKQPVTLPEVIELRGVKSGGVLKTLLEKRLIKIVGRKEVVGRPMLYGTSKEFLLHFGLKDLAELPRIEEFAEVLGEEVDVVGLKRAIEAPLPSEVPLLETEATQVALPLTEDPIDAQPAGPPEDPDSRD